MKKPTDLQQAAKSARAEGRFTAAAGTYEELAGCLEDPSPALLRAALCAALSGSLNETARLFDSFFWAAKRPSFANLNDLLSLYHQTGQQERVAEAVDRLLLRQSDGQGQQRKRRQVMVFALPKSAGTSVVQTLASTIGVPHVASGSDDPRTPGYSAPLLEPRLLERLSERGLLHQTHALPWKENLEQIQQHSSSRIIVHLRDPRDALLSYYYMAEKYELHRLRLLLLYPDYDQLDPPARMELLSRTVYPVFLEWITGWVAAADIIGDKARVTTFESFKQDPETFFRQLTFFLSSRDLPLAPVKKTHFRKGQSGQTDDPLMPPEIREDLYGAIPVELARRFGWEI